MTQLLVSKSLQDYAEEYTSDEDPILAGLSRETHLKVPLSIMLSGHLQGAMLEMISQMVKPTRILEIGTYTGYSAMCLAKGLVNEGVLHTIEINEELEDIAFRYFCKAGLDKKITQHIGKAEEIIPSIEEQFDLVFIDADKPNYQLYYDLVFNKVSLGGFILADNVLYDGEVVLPEEEQSKNARSIHLFNAMVRKDKRVEHVLLPLRDGIMIVRKISE